MKIKFLAFIALSMLVVGCSQGSQGTLSTNHLVKDSSEVREFFLDGVSYELETSTLKAFKDNGWKVEEDKKLEDFDINPAEYVKIVVTKENESVDLTLLNHTDKNVKDLELLKFVGLYYMPHKKEAEDVDFFVVNKGVHLDTSQNLTKETLSDLQVYGDEDSTESEENVLVYGGEFETLRISFEDNRPLSFKLSSIDTYTYTAYVSKQERADNKNQYKEEIEKESAQYLPNNYSKIEADLEESKSVVSIFAEMQVVDSLEMSKEYNFASNYGQAVYLMKDEKGNFYALLKDEFTLDEGQRITFWGSCFKVAKYNETNIPVLIADYMNSSNQEIYSK